MAALALRRPELAIVVAPFAFVLALGTRATQEPGLEVDLQLDAERTVEEVDVAAEVSLSTARPVDRLELAFDLPPGVDVGQNAYALHMRAGQERELPLRARSARWGIYDLGRIELRARDALRLVVWEGRFRAPRPLRVYPRPEALSRIVAPVETQAFAGSEVARVKGDGIEYADIRAYVPGDRLRSINWRASARRGALIVNERHPERNTDVVLFVDSFADVQGEGRSTLEDAVRAAASIATRYLERRDRVGLVSFGGVLRWLQPSMGVTQRFRLVETLLETGVQPTYTWRDVNLIPARIMPPKALVVGLTPLVDPRFVTALADLRARGFDVVVVEVDPVGLVVPGPSDVDRLAHRLWLLEREVQAAKLARLGIAVAHWRDEVALDAALEEVRTYRRYARVARA